MSKHYEETVQLQRKKVTLPSLLSMHAERKKISMLTCYDASFAELMDRCGVDVLLVGDSIGMVCQGHTSTLPVSIADISYHVSCVVRGNKTAFVTADLPFGSYSTPDAAYQSAVELMKAGAQMVKLEGGAWLSDTVRFLTERGIPVLAHLGLTPQYVHQFGGYKVQGKTPEAAERLLQDAMVLEEAGASMVLLEAIPAAQGKRVTDSLSIPTIGIGAGPDCSGQVLVMHDMLGVYAGKPARFVKNFMEQQTSIENAIRAFVSAVREVTFPSAEHSF